MVVSPYLFHQVSDVELTLNYEVDEVIWIPVSFLTNRSNRETMIWKRGGARVPLPCYMYKGRRVWGLSLMMLDELMDIVEGTNPNRPRWRRR